MKYKHRNFFRIALTASKLEPQVAKVTVAEEDACAWKVTLGPFILDTDPVGTSFEPTFGTDGPQAKVQWGGGQVRFQAEVDWNIGSTFVVHGDNIELFLVNVPDVAVNGVPPTFPTDRIFATATIIPSAGGRDNHRPPTRSFHVSAAAGNTNLVRMPRWARRMRWWPTNAPAAGTLVRIAYFDNISATVARYNPAASPAADWSQDPYAANPFASGHTFYSSWVDIPAQANFVLFQPIVAQFEAHVEFELDIG